MTSCFYSSRDLTDAEFIDSYVFNKLEYIRFNSTVGRYVGYTEHGIKNAEAWNNDPAILASERGELERFCKPNAALHYSVILDKSGEQPS